jgi:hypothetical protein
LVSAEPDEFGFPTNEEYLRSQGLNLVDANRQLVGLQEQFQQLQQVMSDPQLRQQFFAEYDRLGSESQPQPPAQRPTFPGGNAPPSSQFSAADLQTHYEQIRQAASFGNPLDQLDQSQANWDSIPNDVWRSLAFDLIRGDF